MTRSSSRFSAVPMVLSVQSHVAFGHVGNAAAVFALQRMGFEVWPVHTCQLSTHTGYPAFRGQMFSPEHVRDVLLGLTEQGVPQACAGLLSGYLGRAEVGEAILEAVRAARAEQREFIYLCDPVMGDDTEEGAGRIYAASGVPEFLRDRLVPAADVITPNRFELEVLAGRPVGTVDEALAAARVLLAKGPRLCIVTSMPTGDPARIACLAVTAADAWKVETPRIVMEQPVNGAGDMLAALMLGHVLRREQPPEAIAAAVGSLYGVIEMTAETGARELQIVAAQDEISHKSRRFGAITLEN